jgi:hypothetical protein
MDPQFLTSHFCRSLVFAAAVVSGASPLRAQGLDDKVVIITSFSKDLTQPYAQAFEKKYPGIKVEVESQHGIRRRLHPRDEIEPAGYFLGVCARRL